MRYVVLSVDYEVFGNGSGDVLQHIVQPAADMARVCRDHGVPLTVFFEAEEYHSFVEYRQPLTRALGYDPAQKIAAQVAALAAQGHDFHLHLHPEWVGARFEQGRWLLHRNHRTVDDLFESQQETTLFIAARKRLLETLMAAGGVHRQVTAYRAGAFSAQPGVKLLAALAANGFLIDSSVVKGLHGSPNLDYRQAPSAKGPWRVNDEVSREDSSGRLWEFPICSIMGRRLEQLTLSRLRAKFSKNVPKDRQMEMVSQLGINHRNPFALLKFLWQPVPIKLDFHNVSPARLLRWIKAAPASNAGNPDVVVLIGHTKEHMDNAAFARLLQGLTSDASLKVVGFEDVAKMVAALPASASICLDSARALPA